MAAFTNPVTGEPVVPVITLGQDISNRKGVLGYDLRWCPAPRPPIHGAPFTKGRSFQPPSSTDTPRDLFIHHASEDRRDDLCHLNAHRFVRRTNDRERLVYTDGSCLDQNDATDTMIRRAGCAVVFRPAPYATDERVNAFRLEAKGPTGVEAPQTSNRAELRAVIGALHFLEKAVTDSWLPPTASTWFLASRTASRTGRHQRILMRSAMACVLQAYATH